MRGIVLGAGNLTNFRGGQSVQERSSNGTGHENQMSNILGSSKWYSRQPGKYQEGGKNVLLPSEDSLHCGLNGIHLVAPRQFMPTLSIRVRSHPTKINTKRAPSVDLLVLLTAVEYCTTSLL